jgi:magnesium-protoporphyrin O-methyltransferase
VAGCCDPRGYDAFFTARAARRAADRYRRRGLDRTSRRIVAFLEREGIGGASVLEIGGGVGELQLELLRRGAARTVNLELSTTYEHDAAALLREAGLADRAERRLLDLAADPGGVPPAEAVVLNRVVCCYPDYERLLGAAADRAQRLLVFSHPPRNVVTRAFLAASNAWFRLRGIEFRGFAHPPDAMLGVLAEHGFERAFAERGVVWRVVGLQRSGAAGT